MESMSERTVLEQDIRSLTTILADVNYVSGGEAYKTHSDNTVKLYTALSTLLTRGCYGQEAEDAVAVSGQSGLDGLVLMAVDSQAGAHSANSKDGSESDEINWNLEEVVPSLKGMDELEKDARPDRSLHEYSSDLMQALYLTSLDYKNRITQLQRVIFLSCFPKILYRYRQALNITGARTSVSSFLEDWNLLDGDEVDEQYVRAPGQLHRQLTHDGIPSRQNEGWTEFLYSRTTVRSWAWSFCGPFLQLQVCIPKFHEQYASTKVAPELLNDINNALFLLNLYLDCEGIRQLFNISSIKNQFDDVACRRGQNSQQDSREHAEVPIQEDSHPIMQAWKAVTVWNISARMLAHYWEKHLPRSNLPKFYLIQLSILGPSAKAMTDPVAIFKSILPRLSASAFSALSPEERTSELAKQYTSSPAEFRGRVHGEACFMTLFCPPPESEHLVNRFTFERSHLLRNLTQLTISQYVCVPRQICYACAKLRTFMKLDVFLPDSHGRIAPWTPPPDLPLHVLRALREDFERILIDHISKS